MSLVEKPYLCQKHTTGRHGQWLLFDKKAIVNEDGVTATLIADKVGTFIVRVPDKYSIPTVDCQGSSQDKSGSGRKADLKTTR